MAEVKWIKVSTDMFESNRKIKQIEMMPEGDTVLVIWLKLLLLAGNVNDGGAIYLTPEIPYTEEMLATELRRPLNTVKTALAEFERFGMIEIVDDILHLSSWEKYQNTEKLNEIREYNRIAKQRSRERRKQLQDVNDNVNDKSMTSQPCHDTELDKESKERITTTTTGAPTRATVFLYFKQIHDGDAVNEAEKFYAYNDTRGWDCLPNWTAAADLWIARIKER